VLISLLSVRLKVHMTAILSNVTPCNPAENLSKFQKKKILPPSSTPKREAAVSSETSINFNQITLRHTP
jgi:hypothetical protein